MSEPKLKNVRTTATTSESDTPTQALVKANLQRVEVEDAQGRKFVVKRLSEIEKMILARKIGPDANNQAYFGYVLVAASVVSIDGEPEPAIQNSRMAEALVSQLASDGLEAVGEAFGRLNNATGEDLEHAKN